MMNSTILTEKWLEAIDTATACLRRMPTAPFLDEINHRGAASRSRGGAGNNNNAIMEMLEHSLRYLMVLESHLRKREASWDRPPRKLPPPWTTTTTTTSPLMMMMTTSSSPPSPPSAPLPRDVTPPTHAPPTVSPLLSPSWHSPNNNPSFHHQQDFASVNSFAAFQDSSDDDDDDDDDVSESELEDAGDEPILNIAFSSGSNTNNSKFMSMRRLLIRILTSQSEIFAAVATQLRRNSNATLPQWTVGAAQLSNSLVRIHNALMLADSEISKWLLVADNNNNANNNNNNNNNFDIDMDREQPQHLVADADIVAVAVQSLTQNRDLFLQEAQRQEAALLRKLTPQWKTRDDVKKRMGKQRWCNNPSPRNDYAKLRQEAEQQLRDVRSAMQQLDAIDIGTLEASSAALQARLKATSRRYNGMRPNKDVLSNRKSLVDYPDPTEFGWTFTGSWDVTEFFEKDGVKLDWYFTTGTVKTSLDHPKQGKTQLFGAQVDPETYRQILLNPRHHTGNRYYNSRRRQRRNKNSNK